MFLNKISTIILMQILASSAFFHEQSMKTFHAPASVPEQGLFGYSISYQSSKKSLITSAPRADNVGQIFTIDLLSSNITRLHSTLQDKIFQLSRNKTSSGWWYGATVKATDDFFVTCAPRYQEIKPTSRKKDTKVIVNMGVCFLQVDADVKQLTPLKRDDRIMNTTNFESRMDTFGWSIHIIEPRKVVLIGGPAQHIGRVSVYEKPKTNERPILMNRILANDPVRLNFGYNIAYGNFFTEKYLYAVSTTFGDVGFGKVYFFNEDYGHVNTITNDQVGSMFGACLCAVRLAGRYDSLLVGAPAYAEQGYADTGAVYLFVPDSDTLPTMLILKKMIKAHSDGGYFGITMTNLGDMDGDHKDEVAIAAPYEDDGMGAIYIYSGEALYNEPTIYRSKIKQIGFRAFGLSLTTVWDYDNNGCNELSVGAPDSNKIVLLNSLASVTVNLKTEFPSLKFEGNNNVEKLYFKVLLNVVYPEKPSKIKADVKVTVELTDPNSKFLDEVTGKYSYIVSLNDKKPSYSRDIGVEIVIPKSDIFKMISYRITAELQNDPMMLPFDPNRVLLSDRSVLSIQDSKWRSSCGVGKSKCVPKLMPTLKTSMSDKYIIGSSEREHFNISIVNEGDIAYTPCLNIRVRGVRVLKPPRDCIKSSDDEVICNPAVSISNGCNWDINGLELEMDTLNSRDEEILITYDLYNHCNDESEKGQNYNNILPLYPDINFDLMGRSNPGDIVDTTVDKIMEFQKRIKHVYTVTNTGVTNWVGLQCEVLFKNSDHINILNSSVLVYPESGAIQCSLEDTSGIFLCNFPLNRNQKAQIHVAIDLLPETFKASNEDRNVTISTELYLITNKVKSKTYLSSQNKGVERTRRTGKKLSATLFFRQVLLLHKSLRSCNNYIMLFANAHYNDKNSGMKTKSILRHIQALESFSISTILHIKTTTVALWIIILSSLIGLLLLVIIAFILYKCGFFRRNTRKKIEDLKESVKRQSVYRMSMRASMHGPTKSDIGDHQALVDLNKTRKDI